MINFISSWVKLIVSVYIFITLVEIILPSNSLKRYAKFVLGLIVLITILIPVFNMFGKEIDISNSINKYISYYEGSTESIKIEDNYNKEIINQFKMNLKNNLENEIDQNFNNKYDVLLIQVNENMKSVGFGKIERIVLSLNSKNNIKSIEKVVIGSNKNEASFEIRNMDVIKFLKENYGIGENTIEFER
ncbi:Stage III sporulation protein AF [Caloramator mitchellensis]|uniref:Stage III sporulation protein AF n=1 Tax=Caloramator mitchellensis TaxID=908809 RepID=A0A0R3JTH5_CALMK|nr:stage III sporulation protein AF [Caloramator mitchellensis]KRQ86838.1 Stage III sporulation protein AF [Caloramator mitchellensis]